MVIVVSTGGTAVTVIVFVALTLPDAAVMTAEPTATPVTTPDPLTVAMPVAFDDHVIVAAMALPFWSFGAAVSGRVEPTTTEAAPLRVIVVSARGTTVTVTVPLTLPDVAVMTAVPAATPVTSPLPLTVATPVAFDDHATVATMALPFWSLGDAVSCSVAATTTLVPPATVMVVSASSAVTVTVVVVLTLPDDAVITAVPGATPVTMPLELTVAMFVAPDDQLTVAEMALPLWSLGLATSASVAPAATVAPPDIEIDVSTGVGDVGDLSPPPEQPRSAAASAATRRDRRTVYM